MVEFTKQEVIRFGHCDVAGMVFYPRFFEMTNALIEDWFAEALTCDFRQVHLDRRLGIPVVRLETDFIKPSMLGDRLVWTLRVTALGTASFTVEAVLADPDGPRLRARLTLVCISVDTHKPTPIPPDLRQKIELFYSA